VSARAARPGRFVRSRTTNSAARCRASAALPPFPKKNELAPGAQSGCGFLCELRDPADQFGREKTLFHASAFLELAANLFG